MISYISKIKELLVNYKVYFKSGFLYLFSTFFIAVIGIISNPFLAKNLSSEDYAILGYFGSFALFILPILNFSLITYYLRNYYKIAEERRQIVSDTILITLLVFGFLALIIVYLGFYLYYRINDVNLPFYPFALLTFLPIYLNNFVTLLLANYRLKREAGKYSRFTIINGLLSTSLAIFLVVVFKYGATGRLVATFIATLIVSGYAFWQLWGKLQFDFSVVKDAFNFGWPLSLSAILWYFFSGVDRAMLVKLNDSHTFGFYNVGVQIVGYFAVFYTTISQTFEPDVYKAIAENNKRKIIKFISVIIILNAFPNVIFIFFAPYIISILTYDKFTEASIFAQILALKNISISFYYSVIAVIVGYGYTKSLLSIQIIGALVCFLLFKLLINSYGFFGAAWGQVFSFIIMTLFGSFFIYRKLQKSRKNEGT